MACHLAPDRHLATADAAELAEPHVGRARAARGPCGGCLTVLHELSEASGPLDLIQLAEAVRSLAPPGGEDLDDSAEHAADTVAFLVDYGAAAALEVPEATVKAELTPLGRMLAESLFTGCAPPAEADAATLMD